MKPRMNANRRTPRRYRLHRQLRVDMPSCNFSIMPGTESQGLPEFERPPVIETILGIHFKPIRGLTTAHLGLFWEHLGRDQWPTLHELSPIAPQMERFDVSPSAPQRFMLKAMELPEVRIRLSNADESRVVQLQPNLLQTHWVRKPDAAYPRYTQSTKPGFLSIWTRFCEFLTSNKLVSPDLLQWEVTYINQIPAGEGELWQTPQDWPALFNGVLMPPAIPDGSVESGRAKYHYRLSADHGRLHLEVRHVLGSDGGPESLTLTLTARGPVTANTTPTNQSIAPTIEKRISAGLDLGRRAIVRGFKAFGSKKALDFWGYKEEVADV